MRSSLEAKKIRFHGRNLTLTMKNHIFDGVDPIHIFAFLTRFVYKVDTLNMSDAQAFIALTSFMADRAKTQLRNTISGG